MNTYGPSGTNWLKEQSISENHLKSLTATNISNKFKNKFSESRVGSCGNLAGADRNVMVGAGNSTLLQNGTRNAKLAVGFRLSN